MWSHCKDKHIVLEASTILAQFICECLRELGIYIGQEISIQNESSNGVGLFMCGHHLSGSSLFYSVTWKVAKTLWSLFPREKLDH